MPLWVWNRTPSKSGILAEAEAGAAVAKDSAEVFARCEVVIFMLVDAAAIDSVLGRGTPDFGANIAQHPIVQRGTTSPDYSRGLEAEIRSRG